MHGVVQYDLSSLRGPLLNAFVILINALFINVKLIGVPEEHYPKDMSERLLKEEERIFDFVIVGGGAAGCAVAYQITNHSQWSVLLVEAGAYPSVTTYAPRMYPSLIGSVEDWHFRMEKRPDVCQAYSDKVCRISRGKVLGGTSSINHCAYIRGLPDDYERNQFNEWSANVMFEIFESVENYTGSREFYYPFGRNGMWHISDGNHSDASQEFLEKVYFNSGSKRKESKRQAIGITNHMLATEGGERINAARAFLTPIKGRPNFFLATNTIAEAIGVTEPVDKRANGVNISIDGHKFFIQARKEVILTAGAINNAKLLLLSGIGSKSSLEEQKLPLQMHIPEVGKNLQMHVTVPIYISVSRLCESCSPEAYDDTQLLQDTFDYVIFRTGNFTHTLVDSFANYILTRNTGTTLPNLLVQHMYFKIGDRNLKVWLEAMDYHRKIHKKLIKVNEEKPMLLFLLTLLHPLSRGEVRLNKTHLLGDPCIEGNFFTDEENYDLATMVTGFSYITNLTQYMEDVNGTYFDADVPDCKNFKFCSLRWVKCYIKNMAFPFGSVAGTAKMGPECDNTAVVKEDLEVRHVRCLRVGDSSVLNSLPRGNTVATDAAIGFKLGEILKTKWMKDYEGRFQYRKDDDEEN